MPIKVQAKPNNYGIKIYKQNTQINA